MILILIGLFGLWFGTKWVINGALGVASRFGLSHSFVGLAILAVGTDLPEVFVTLKGSILQLQGIESSGIITGNAIGSSISQITVILGISALLLPFSMEKKDLIRNGVFLLGSSLLLFVLGLDGIINRFEGSILVLVYILYFYLLVKGGFNRADRDQTTEGKDSIAAIVLFLLFGFVVLIYSSHIVVENAMLLAENWGVAQSFVGIAIIGLGTSLPELAVSFGAAFRKSADMSIGNIVGSNIFDGLIPIGLGGMISTTTMERSLLTYDLPILFGSTILVLILLRTHRGISRLEGAILIFLYLSYIVLRVTIVGT